MPELGKATYVVEIESRDFERGLKALDKKTQASAQKQNRQLNGMADNWNKVTVGVTRTSDAVDGNTRSVDRNRKSLRGFGNDLTRLNQALSLFGKVLSVAKIPAFAAAIGYAVKAVNALVAGTLALVGALGPLSGALVAMPALFGSMAQAMATVTLGFSPIIGVLKEMSAAQERAGGSAASSAKATKSAARAVASAEKQLEQAHKATTAAIGELSAARRQAIRDLKDMQLANEGAQLSEDRAKLSAQEARRELAKAEGSGKASAAEIRDMRLSLEEAELGVKESRVSAKRSAEDLETAERKGIHGSEAMVSARENIAAAKEEEKAATEALTTATESLAEAGEQSSGAASKLSYNLAKLSPQARKLVTYLFSLKSRLQDLRDAAGRKMFPGVESGIRFSLKNFPVFEHVLERTGGAIGNLAERAGKLLGSKSFGERFKKIGDSNARTIEHLGNAGLSTVNALSRVLVVARPLVDWMGKLAERFGQWLNVQAKAGQESGRMARFFERTKEVMTTLGHTLRDLGAGLFNIMKIGAPLGREILDVFEKSAASFRDWTESAKGKNTIAEYFKEMKAPLWEMGRLLHDLTVDLFGLGKAEGLTPFIHALRVEVLPVLTEFLTETTNSFGPVMTHALVQLIKLAGIFAGTSGPLEVAVKIITKIAEAINWISKEIPGAKEVMVTLVGAAAIFKGVKFAGWMTGLSGVVGMLKKVAERLGVINAMDAAMGGAEGAGGLKGLASSVKGKAGGVLGRVKGALGLGAKAAPAAATTAGMIGIEDMGAMGLSGAAPAAAAAAPAVAPWLAVGAAIAAAAAGIYLLYKHSKTFRELVKPVTDAAVKGFGEIKKSFGPLVDAVTELADSFGGNSELAKNLKFLWGYTKPILTAMAGFWKTIFVGQIKGAIATLAMAIRGIAQVLSGQVQIIRGVVEVITGIFTLKFSKVWKGLKNIFGGGIKAVIGMFKIGFAPVAGLIANVGHVMSTAFGGVWDKVKGVFEDGINAVIDVVNDMIGLVNKLPFIEIGKIGHVGGSTSGGRDMSTAKQYKDRAEAERKGKPVHRIRGGHINEGKPSGDSVPAMLERDEYVLNRKAVRAMGGPRELDKVNFGLAPRFGEGRKPKQVGGLAHLSIGSFVGDVAGGAYNAVTDPIGTARGIAGDVAVGPILNALPDPGSGFFGSIAGYMKDKLVAWVKGENAKHQKEIAQSSAGYTGPAYGPTGTSMYKGILMANWVRQSLEFAAAKGVAPQPTSGYRSHAQNVAEGRNYFSEHEKTQYPGGAVDFGGMYGEPAAKAAKMSVVRATSSYKWPLLAPIGFVDDGHASGTGHQLGGLVGLRSGGYVGDINHVWAEHNSADGDWGGPTLPSYVVAALAQAAGAPGTTMEQVTRGESGSGRPNSARPGATGVDPGGTKGLGLWMITTGYNDDKIRKWGGQAAMRNPVKNAAAMNEVYDSQGLGAWYGTGSVTGDGVAYTGKYDISDALGGRTYQEALTGKPAAAEKGSGKPAHKDAPKYVTGEYTRKTKKPGFAPGGFTVEEEKAHYKVQTDPIAFPPIPTKLKDIIKELRYWQRKLPQYKAALKKVKGSGTKAMIAANIKLIEAHIKKLRAAAEKARLAERVAKSVARIHKAAEFLPWTEDGGLFQQAEDRYYSLMETAEQVLALEPEEPQSVSADWIKNTLEPYVLGQGPHQESGALGAVLGAEASWRNTIIGAEEYAGTSMEGWRDHITKLTERIKAAHDREDQIRDRIKEIEGYKGKNPNAWEKWKGKLPGLRAELKDISPRISGWDQERGAYRASIQKTRTETLPEWADALASVQGRNATKQKLATLPPYQEVGGFGELIWDTQGEISGLGLKIKSAEGNIEQSEKDSALAELYKQQAEEATKRAVVSESLNPVFQEFFAHVPKYGGKFHSGGVVPGRPREERTIIAQAGEIIAQPDNMSSAAETDGNHYHATVIEDGAIDQSKIRDVFGDEARRAISTSRRRVRG